MGTYPVSLTVSGSCGTAVATTTADIRDICIANAFLRGGNRTIRLGSETVTEIHAVAEKSAHAGDTDGNGIDEITACSRKDDLRQLLGGLPPGENSPTVTLRWDGLVTGGKFQATLTLRVIVESGSALAASVSPNPPRSGGTLTFVTSRPGSSGGRVVPFAGATHRRLEENQTGRPVLPDAPCRPRGRKNCSPLVPRT